MDENTENLIEHEWQEQKARGHNDLNVFAGYMYNELAEWSELKNGSWEKVPQYSEEQIIKVIALNR